MIVKQFVNTAFGLLEQVGWVPVSVSTMGANQVLAAVPGFRILVLGYLLVASADVSVDFEDSDGDVLSGPYSIFSTGGNYAAPNEFLQFPIKANSGLVLNLSIGIQVGGHIVYGLITG